MPENIAESQRQGGRGQDHAQYGRGATNVSARLKYEVCMSMRGMGIRLGIEEGIRNQGFTEKRY